MTEPNCDMPWEIYLDWLQDQGNEDLRDIEIGYLFNGDELGVCYHGFYYDSFGCCHLLNDLCSGNGKNYYFDADNGIENFIGCGSRLEFLDCEINTRGSGVYV